MRTSPTWPPPSRPPVQLHLSFSADGRHQPRVDRVELVPVGGAARRIEALRALARGGGGAGAERGGAAARRGAAAGEVAVEPPPEVRRVPGGAVFVFVVCETEDGEAGWR